MEVVVDGGKLLVVNGSAHLFPDPVPRCDAAAAHSLPWMPCDKRLG